MSDTHPRDGHTRHPGQPSHANPTETGSMTGPRTGIAGLARSPGEAGARDVDDPRLLGTGTTTVGLRAADAVVLATDRRASVGGGRFVTNRDAEKIHAVHPRAAVTIAGSVAGAQAFVDGLRAEASLTETRRGEPLSIPALASLAATLLRQGFGVSPLIGGVDADGAHLYEADLAGGLMEKSIAAAGSGMPVAYGTLERATDGSGGEHGLDAAASRDLATDAVAAASERDTASGNGVAIATITDAGIEMEHVTEGSR